MVYRNRYEPVHSPCVRFVAKSGPQKGLFVLLSPHTASDYIEMQAIEVDGYLRVKGAPLGTVYAMGDSATVSKLTWRFANHNDARHRSKLL